MKTRKNYPLRRNARPRWLQSFGIAFAYVVLLPIVKVLEYFGWWPRLLARAMAKRMMDVKGYEPAGNDVLVCSYFKSGTNWTMQIALQIAHRGEASFDHIHDLIPWPDMPESTGYAISVRDESVRRDSVDGLRVVKTHLALGDLPMNPSARYVYVVRDPKDVFVSSYHFIRATALGPLMPSVEKWLDLYLSPATVLGSWAKHLHEGWESRHNENVLFLTYEDMKVDLRSAIVTIAEFMDVHLSSHELDRVVEQSSYAHMKTIGYKFDVPFGGAPWALGEGAMIRKGERDRSGEMISTLDQKRIDEYWRAQLTALGSDFPYDEKFTAS